MLHLLYVAIPNVVAGCIYLEVCSTTEWKSQKFIFIPGHPSAGVKVNCVSAVTLYYLGCKFLIIMVLVEMTLGIGENSYELNSTLNPLRIA